MPSLFFKVDKDIALLQLCVLSLYTFRYMLREGITTCQGASRNTRRMEMLPRATAHLDH